MFLMSMIMAMGDIAHQVKTQIQQEYQIFCIVKCQFRNHILIEMRSIIVWC